MKPGFKRTSFIAICITPAILLFSIFMLIPTFNIFRISLFKWGGYSPKKIFVGMDNFFKLTSDTNFLRSFQNTLLIIVIVTVVTLSLALFFAGILTRQKVKAQNLFRIVFYIPNILSVIVIAAVFNSIYDPNSGLLNSILLPVQKIFDQDAQPVYWLGDQKIVVYSLMGAMIWQAIGYYMVMYMASMSSVPDSIYESADLDGASLGKQFFSITIPLIWTNIRTTLTFFVISTINMSFLFVRAITNGGPDGSSEVFLSYMYKQAHTNSSYGYGMAIGVTVFLFSFLLSAIINRITKREVLEF